MIKKYNSRCFFINEYLDVSFPQISVRLIFNNKAQKFVMSRYFLFGDYPNKWLYWLKHGSLIWIVVYGWSSNFVF